MDEQQPKCPRCADPGHALLACPYVKAVEFEHPGDLGSIRRVEFLTPADLGPPPLRPADGGEPQPDYPRKRSNA